MSKKNSTSSNPSMQMSLFDALPQEDKRPLPELIASGGTDWAAFPLAYSDVENVRYYAVQDWIRGVALSENPRRLWTDLKSRYNPENIPDSLRKDKRGRAPITKEAAQRVQDQLYVSVVQLPYLSSNGKTYQLDHATAEGLYFITELMDAESGIRDRILAYLAKAGVKLDEIRIDPNKITTLVSPGQAMDASLKGYALAGKSGQWQEARIASKVNRQWFVAAIKAALGDEAQFHYGQATNTVYVGIFDRTASQMRAELGITNKDSLRDHFTDVGLHYNGIVESIVAFELGNKTELEWIECVAVIKSVAALIKPQVMATSQRLGIDLATGRKLLTRNVKP